MPPKQNEWTIAHLAMEEPEAAAYLDDDEWDHSTIASTPSMKERHSSDTTTILRNAGEPAHIIISSCGQQKRISLSQRAAQRLWKALRHFLLGLIAKKRLERAAAGDASTAQPSLGVNGVMV